MTRNTTAGTSGRNSDKVYLDATFWAAYFVPWHRDHKQVLKILARLVKDGNERLVSPLVFDEFWHAVKKEVDFKCGNQRNLRRVNRILRHVSCKILFHERNFAYLAVFPKLEEATTRMINLKLVDIVQFPNPVLGVEQALRNIKDGYSLKPRDAFHLAMMQENNIPTILTKDAKFLRKSVIGIEAKTY